MDRRYRSRRKELAALRAELGAKGAPTRQVAILIAARFQVNSRVASSAALGPIWLLARAVHSRCRDVT